MTMEIVVRNNSENYVGKVIEIDHYENNAPSDGGEHILQPGEEKSFYVYKERSIRVEEVKEIEQDYK